MSRPISYLDISIPLTSAPAQPTIRLRRDAQIVTEIQAPYAVVTRLLAEAQPQAGDASAWEYLDLLSLPTPLLLARKAELQAAVIFKVESEPLSIRGVLHQIGLPLAIAGVWQGPQLVWSGCGIFPSMPLTLAAAQQMAIWPWALGNVYGHGAICWGEVRNSDLTHPGMIGALYTRFFTSPFNGDLVNTGMYRLHRRAGSSPVIHDVEITGPATLQLDTWLRRQ